MDSLMYFSPSLRRQGLIYKIAITEDNEYVGTLTFKGEVFTTQDFEEAQDVIEELEEHNDEYDYHIISEELH